MATKTKTATPLPQKLNAATAEKIRAALRLLSQARTAPFSAKTIIVIDLVEEHEMVVFSFQSDCGEIVKGIIENDEITIYFPEHEMHRDFYVDYFKNTFLKG